VAKIEDLTGKSVQGWTLGKELGRGADGIVYAGEREGVTAAIKIFLPDALQKNGLSAAKERLELQLNLVGKKQHPNLVEIYEGGEDSELGTLFVTMELVPGTSLDKLIGKIPLTVLPALAAQLASAASFLNDLGLVHRDIKPANIVVSDDFKKLTLLDLGIVHHAAEDDETGQLSGDEFVATLRYSPPEFVWRKEEREVDGAWRAITFYQIGATFHDLIMGKPLFAGADKPRACLYDAVRDLTPTVESDEVDRWLVQLTRACLLKDWRQRLQFVTWDSFLGPPPAGDPSIQESRIRLRQIQNEERRRAAAKVVAPLPGPSREQRLWQLNDALTVELRTYVMDANIFPMCRVIETAQSSLSYRVEFHFETDLTRDFPQGVVFVVELGVDEAFPQAERLSFEARIGATILSPATWTEMFTVELAFARCKRAFLDAVESQISG